MHARLSEAAARQVETATQSTPENIYTRVSRIKVHTRVYSRIRMTYLVKSKMPLSNGSGNCPTTNTSPHIYGNGMNERHQPKIATSNIKLTQNHNKQLTVNNSFLPKTPSLTITSSLEHVCHSRQIERQTVGRGWRNPVNNAVVHGVSTGHERCTRRRANVLRVILFENDAIVRERVDVRGANIPRAKSHIIKTQIVDDNEQNVRSRLRRFRHTNDARSQSAEAADLYHRCKIEWESVARLRSVCTRSGKKLWLDFFFAANTNSDGTRAPVRQPI